MESHHKELHHFQNKPGVRVQSIIEALEKHYKKQGTSTRETAHHKKKRSAEINPRMFLLERHLPILNQICGLQDGSTNSPHSRDWKHTYALCDQSLTSRVLFESSTKACRKCNKYMHHINSELHTLTRNVKRLSSNLESCSDEIRRDAQRSLYSSNVLQVQEPSVDSSGIYRDSQTEDTPKQKRSVSDDSSGNESHTDASGLTHVNGTSEHHDEHHEHHSYAHTLHEVAHALHVTSTVILGIFVVQVTSIMFFTDPQISCLLAICLPCNYSATF